MNWWCSALDAPWSWTPRWYVGVWILCLAIAGGYTAAIVSRHRRHPDEPVDTRRAVLFGLGVVSLWIASDWPVGTLGASYLASVHMLQYMLYTLLAAPLLMLGTPGWMAETVLERTGLHSVHRLLAKPLIAGVVFNVVLIATHAPVSVDALRATQIGSFLLDMTWLLSGLILWTPVMSPVREDRARSAPVKLVYLFAAAALIPMIPGGFITFSAFPLYSTYELAPRVGLSPLHDQQFAGVLMKIGNLPVIWTVMGVIWFRWYREENRRPAHRARPVVTGGPPVPPTGDGAPTVNLTGPATTGRPDRAGTLTP